MKRISSVVTLAALGVLPLAGWGADDPATCTSCHPEKASLIAKSVHKAVKCRECHGGGESYELTPQQAQAYHRPASAQVRRPAFDHGPDFLGRASRAEMPELCGGCHADVRRMNPYGIRTDQLAAYWTSGHGTALRERAEERVAVCVDCHGTHDILPSGEPASRTNPMNIPRKCAACHGDADLMAEFDLPALIIDEYSRSVHGRLLLEQGDTGAPTCATCHGNHAAAPPGFATVGAVCGKCHQQSTQNFTASVHAAEKAFNGCVRCHGGGPQAYSHLIERVTEPPLILTQRYAALLARQGTLTDLQIAQMMHPQPKELITAVLPACSDCHGTIEEDESLRKAFGLLEEIAHAEVRYVKTAAFLDRVGQGVLLVDSQRFKFEDAKTHLIALAPLQHTLSTELVTESITMLNAVCNGVEAELTDLENGLRWRHRALIPVWIFALAFSAALYVKYRQLRTLYVKPLPDRGH